MAAIGVQADLETVETMAVYNAKIPEFDLREKTYERYRFELDCWRDNTKLDKKSQALQVFLSLPEGNKDESRMRDYIYSRMKKADLVAENGFDELVKVMDEHLREDNLGRIWTTFDKFDDIKRKEGQSIDDYIVEFDIAVNLLKTENVPIHAAVCALLLIRRAGIGNDNIKLCLTGLDYSDMNKLYSQAKNSLRKYGKKPILAGGTDSSQGTTPTVEVKAEVLAVNRGRG